MQAVSGTRQMAGIDWAITAVVVLTVVGALRNGFFVEAFSLGGVVVGLLIASWNFQRLMPWLLKWVHTAALAETIAFLVIALAIMIAAGLIGRALRWSANSIGLGWLDRLVGAVFGLLKGCVLVTLGVMALAAFFPRNGWLEHSRLAPYFLSAAHFSTAVTPTGLGARIRDGVKMIREGQPDWLKPNTELLSGSDIAG
jgi:membrane protein required for colicin V production